MYGRYLERVFVSELAFSFGFVSLVVLYNTFLPILVEFMKDDVRLGLLHIAPDTPLDMFSLKGICSLLHVQCGKVNKALVIEVIRGQGRTMMDLFQNLSLMSHSNSHFVDAV